MKELVCIVCPRGCRLKVDEENAYAVTGNSCPRGAEYGKNEISDPTRVLTSTVRIEGALYPRCPVRSDRPVPKGMMMEIMKKLNAVTLASPVEAETVILENVDGRGANIITSKKL